MVMDGYYGQERLPDLWARINKLHLSYLPMDDSPKKLEHRDKLEDCIKEFLCVAPHAQKFCFKETAEVLHRSASNKKDFSGYKAALGWNAIGMYAGNLISQPWRPEYREIKMYSGFYKHQIEANLIGAEIMFEAMGYKHACNGIMVLEGPICPDRVTNVSQDSLVAYVECQILKEIWEEVCAASFKVTWLEVLQFRESHLCGPQKAAEALKYQIQQRQYHEHHHTRSFSHGSNEDYVVATSNPNYRHHQHHLTSPQYPIANHSFPPLMPALPPMPPPPLPPLAFSNGYGNYGIIPTHYSYPANITNSYGNKPYNSYYCNGGYHNIPTGQLIEIDGGNTEGFDVPDGPVPKTAVMSEPEQKNGQRSEAGFENWEYVYRNLESQGYSKDLGERGDVLKSDRRETQQQLQYDKPSDRPLKINEALEKLKLMDRKPESNPKPAELSSSYENLSCQDVRPTSKASKTLTSKIKANVIDKLDPKKKDKKTPKNVTDKWECAVCTFLNSNSINICDMCGKSKVTVTHEMEIGGSECSKCTLVNPKDKKICEACGASLHNSPTYI